MAARAGAAVRFCAPVGPEAEAAMLHRALAAEPFSRLELVEADYPTDLSTLIVGADGENMIVSTGDCADGITAARAAAFVADMRAADWLLVQGNLGEAATWAAAAQARQMVFNTAPIRWHSPRIQAAATVVVANQGEAEALTGLRDPAQAAAKLGGRSGIVTLGAAGCVLAQGGQTRHFPAPAVQAVDRGGRRVLRRAKRMSGGGHAHRRRHWLCAGGGGAGGVSRRLLCGVSRCGGAARDPRLSRLGQRIRSGTMRSVLGSVRFRIAATSSAVTAGA